jgi:hypothetical protein
MPKLMLIWSAIEHLYFYHAGFLIAGCKPQASFDFVLAASGLDAHRSRLNRPTMRRFSPQALLVIGTLRSGRHPLGGAPRNL